MLKKGKIEKSVWGKRRKPKTGFVIKAKNVTIFNQPEAKQQQEEEEPEFVAFEEQSDNKTIHKFLALSPRKKMQVSIMINALAE